MLEQDPFVLGKLQAVLREGGPKQVAVRILKRAAMRARRSLLSP